MIIIFVFEGVFKFVQNAEEGKTKQRMDMNDVRDATLWIMDTRCSFKVVEECISVPKLDNVTQCNIANWTFRLLMIALNLFVSPWLWSLVTWHTNQNLEKPFLPFVETTFKFEFIACSATCSVSHNVVNIWYVTCI